MAALPGTAEDLYELVCALQREHQSTQLELRAIQRRSAALKAVRNEHHDAVAEERAKRQGMTEKLNDLLACAHHQQAREEGARKAAQDAMDTLRTEQERFLQLCRRRARSDSVTASDGQCRCEPRSNGNSAVKGLDSEVGLVMEADSVAAGALASAAFASTDEQDTVPDSSRTPLPYGAALHTLLTALRAKLMKCVDAVTAASALGEAEDIKAAETPSQPQLAVSLQGQSAKSAADTALFPTAGGAEMIERNRFSPCLGDAPLTNAPSPPFAPPTTTMVSKKHIEFAPLASFQRVTPVSAANANRWGSCAADPALDFPADAAELNSAAGGGGRRHGASGQVPPPSCALLNSGAGVLRRPTKFTVRVASRSSTLLAEAAALGAKRRRTTLVAPSSTSNTPDSSPQNGSMQSSSKPPTAHHDEDGLHDDKRPRRSTNVLALLVNAAATEATISSGQRECDTTRATESTGVPVCGLHGSGGVKLGPRRTVWTWTRDGSKEKRFQNS